MVPFATEIHDIAVEKLGDTAEWNSIITNILKPIASGHISPTSLEQKILNSYITDCQCLYTSLNLLRLSRETVESDFELLYRSQIILQERIKQCSIAMAPGPIRSIPTEVMSEIFYHCLPQPCQPDPSTAPLLLCRVSPLWRDIACTTHSLWNHLDFTSQWKPNMKLFIQPSPFYGQPSPLCQWLSHAGRSQITLTFKCSHDNILPSLVNMALLPNVVDVLRLEIHTLLGPFHQFFALPPCTMKSLKYLVLTQGLPDAHITVFQSSPCLTHILSNNLDFAVNPYISGELPTLQPIFPWSQITHLKITQSIELEIWISALSFCQALEVGSFLLDLRGLDFEYGFNGNDSDPEYENGVAKVHVCGSCLIPKPGELVILAFLKELDLIIGCGESFSLRGFCFPALKTLRFHRGHMPHISPYQQHLIANQPDKFSWNNSLTFLSTLKSLNTLSLIGRVGSVEEIMFLFHCIPSVDFLDLDLQVDYSALFHAITVNPSCPLAAALLPNLDHLQFLLEPTDTQSFLECAIQNMVLSRHNLSHQISTLKHLSILTNSSHNRCLNTIKNIAKNINPYIPTCVKIDLKASRAVPWRRSTDI